MMKKMLAISGSPHENGATQSMLDCAVNAARSNGWDVTVINLYQKEIAYCKGCLGCSSTAKCIINDDIQEIAALLKACDRVVLSAPTYWANVPAVVKNMFDRLMGTAMEETATFPHPRLSPKQQYLLLTSCHTQWPFSYLFGQSSGTFRAMNEFFKTAGMKRLGAICFSNKKRKPTLPDRITKKIERYWIKTT